MKGLEAAKMLPDKDDPDVQKVLSYLQLIEDVKHQTDAHTCARLIEVHQFPKEMVQHPLLKSAEVNYSVCLLTLLFLIFFFF